MPASVPSPVSKNHFDVSIVVPSNSSLNTSVSVSPGSTSSLKATVSVGFGLLVLVCAGTDAVGAISTADSGSGWLLSQAATKTVTSRVAK